MSVASVCPTAALSAVASGARRTRPAAAAAAGVVRPRPAAALRFQQRSSRSTARRQALCVRAVTDVTDANWEEEVLKSSVPVLVDFWATWCGPCKLMHPMMDWAEKEFGGPLKVVKVEADQSPDTIEKYKVYGLPCFIVFKEGKEAEGSHAEGAMTKKSLTTYLAQHAGVAPVAAKA